MSTATLNVLYQSSDSYSMITGVSIASLCYNNQSIPQINLYLLNDEISRDNLEKIKHICDRYQRNLILLDAELVRERTERTGLPKRHGSHALYYKFFVLDMLGEQGVDRVLYLDSDTIVDKSVDALIDFELNEKYPMALPHAFHINWQKKRVGLSENSPYFTPGVMLVDACRYKRKCYLERFLKHQNERYGICDEEIINLEFGEEIRALPIQYNFYPNFYAYGIDNMYEIYDLDRCFESKDEIAAIMKDGPYVLHCLDLMTGRPWEKGNSHPYNNKFNEYLKLTEWTEEDKFVIGRNWLHSMQRIAFSVLPNRLYCRLHREMYKQHIAKADKQAASGIME